MMPPTTQEVLDGLADLQTAAMPPGWRGILESAHAEIERQRAHRMKLERRIHKQRVMLRENWQVIEMRASHKRAWYPSKLLKALLQRRRDGQSEGK